MNKLLIFLFLFVSMQAVAQLAPLHIESKHTENYEYIDGYHMSVVPPEDFKATECYDGFQNIPKGSSISFSKLPADFETAKATVSKKNLTERGLTIRLQREVMMNGHQGFVTKCTQELGGGLFVKYILLINTGEKTTLVNGSFPVVNQDELDTLIRNTMLSIIYHG